MRGELIPEIEMRFWGVMPVLFWRFNGKDRYSKCIWVKYGREMIQLLRLIGTKTAISLILFKKGLVMHVPQGVLIEPVGDIQFNSPLKNI
jgi:hypothetical protein